MAVNFITISMAFILASSAAIPTTSKAAKSKTSDNFAEESDYYGGLSVVSPNVNTHSVPILPQQPGFQLTIGKETGIAPKFDIFYLLESVLPVLANLINTVQYVFQLLRTTFSVIIGKTSFYYDLLVNGMTALNKVFGYGLAIFSALSNRLSYATISKGIASASAAIQPDPGYGFSQYY